ncbi:MAG: cytochrome c oxidase subunit II [Anaerolineae bacterium CG_4_9_14_3_um_filter_57_17]|nr:cytochrome c oxidase subunit II [bacterium]NCT20105.1 cytochrome c oxidase subunit II [bacterium]PJB64365.1 MAG: cytochrome c oxidase subunit II [Anaerolineae bacterium CG_4_9_14_3_um_filter_57_17]
MRNLKHYLAIAVLIALVSVLTYLGMVNANLFPVEASAQAVDIDWLFNLQIKLIAFFFALIVVPIAYSMAVFRRETGDTSDSEPIESNTPLEIAWTILPLILVVWLGYIGADNLAKINAADPGALEINVVAFQWKWRFDYPQGFSSDTLYLPVDQQVLLKMTSPDVLHSFWVPEFRVKQDVVPGRVTDYRITPNRLGDYKVRCAELCGTSHAYMEAPVKIVSRAEYDQWIADQTAIAQANAAASAANPDAGRGQKLYESLGCKACHSTDGSGGIGPTWKGLYGSAVALSDGTSVSADDAYLKSSILEPGAQTVASYTAGAMPASFSNLTDGQIADLIEFMKSLK